MKNRSRHGTHAHRCGGGFAHGPANRASRVAGVAVLCALSTLGCGSWTSLPPSQVPALVAARTEDIRLVDADGDPVTISRSGVQELELVPREGWNLLSPGGRSGLAPWQVVAVAEADVERAEDEGWTWVPTFHEPLQLRLRGDTLVIQDDKRDATVSLRDVEHVRIKQFSNGRTAFWIAMPIASVLLVGLLATIYCQTAGCALSGGN